MWARALHNRCRTCSQRHLPLPALPAIHRLRVRAIHDLPSERRSPGRNPQVLRFAFRSWWNCLLPILPELRFRRDKCKRGRSGNSRRLGGNTRRSIILQSDCRVVLWSRPTVASTWWSATAVPWNALLGANRLVTGDLPQRPKGRRLRARPHLCRASDPTPPEDWHRRGSVAYSLFRVRGPDRRRSPDSQSPDR